MSNVGLTRRSFLKANLAGVALAGLVATAGMAYADPQSDDAEWIANHVETRLLGADGQPMVGLPRWTRMRIVRGLPSGQIQVWVPRFSLVGRVAADAIGPVPAPSPADLQGERPRRSGPAEWWRQPTCLVASLAERTCAPGQVPPIRRCGPSATTRR